MSSTADLRADTERRTVCNTDLLNEIRSIRTTSRHRRRESEKLRDAIRQSSKACDEETGSEDGEV